MIDIILPLAPSINATNAGRKHTRPLTEWKSHAGWLVKCAKLEKIEGPYSFKMEVSRNACRIVIDSAEMVLKSDLADIDARVKHTMDLFVTMGITPDDRHCMRLEVQKT